MGKAVGQKELCDGYSCAACAVHHDPAVFFLLADYLQRIDDACQHHDGSAVLVVMEDWDVQKFFQALFDLEASGSADVLQIDAAESGGEPGDSLDDFFRVLCVQADGHGVHAAEFLEEHSLSFHDGHGCIGADIAQSKYGTSVGDYGHGVGLHGVFVGGFLVLSDYLAGFRHPGRIGQCQVFPGFYGGFGDGFQFSVPLLMHFQRFFVGGHLATSLILFIGYLYHIIVLDSSQEGMSRVFGI